MLHVREFAEARLLRVVRGLQRRRLPREECLDECRQRLLRLRLRASELAERVGVCLLYTSPSPRD